MRSSDVISVQFLMKKKLFCASDGSFSFGSLCFGSKARVVWPSLKLLSFASRDQGTPADTNLVGGRPRIDRGEMVGSDDIQNLLFSASVKN